MGNEFIYSGVSAFFIAVPPQGETKGLTFLRKYKKIQEEMFSQNVVNQLIIRSVKKRQEIFFSDS